jgi:hypothetical protein
VLQQEEFSKTQRTNSICPFAKKSPGVERKKKTMPRKLFKTPPGKSEAIP